MVNTIRKLVLLSQIITVLLLTKGVITYTILIFRPGYLAEGKPLKFFEILSTGHRMTYPIFKLRKILFHFIK